MKRFNSILLIILLQLTMGLFKFLPISACWKIGELLGCVFYWILASKRRVVRENLEVVSARHPEVLVSRSVIMGIFRRSFANLTCSIKIYGMPLERVMEQVDTVIPDELLEDIAVGNGHILCTAHMGNWELLSNVLAIKFPHGASFGAIYRPLDNEFANQYVLKEREKYGCKMFAKRTSVFLLGRFIKEGGNLIMLADQRAGKKSKYARPFFGRDSARSKLPALLQRRTGAKLYMISCHSDEPAKWKIEFTRVPVDSDDTEEILTAITAEYEKEFLAHILDVFWLHKYWKL